MKKPSQNIIVLIVAFAALIIAPLFFKGYWITILLRIFTFVVVCVSWNILSGYTGYFSFGHSVFYGIGSYITFLLIINVTGRDFWPLAVIAGGFGALAFAALIGFPVLRLRGVYFSICMLAVSQVMMALFYSTLLRSVTGGGWGISLTPETIVTNVLELYYAALLIVILGILVAYKVKFSSAGLAMSCIKEDELASETVGIPTTRYKILALLLSSIFVGSIGGIFSIHSAYIIPEHAFGVEWSIIPIAGSILGGIGTLYGPVIGGAVLGLLSELLSISFPGLHLVFLGLLVVVIALYAPEGLNGVILKLRELLKET
jgi:branched-chain amino acid transport system permease protein